MKKRSLHGNPARESDLTSQVSDRATLRGGDYLAASMGAKSFLPRFEPAPFYYETGWHGFRWPLGWNLWLVLKKYGSTDSTK